MIKYLFLFIPGLFVFNATFAQKRDTMIYYLKNSGQFVPTSDSADFFLLVLPPDTSFDMHLFVLKEYYKNGKIRMIGYSKTKTDLTLQGSQISFFPNGHKMSICNYNNGTPVGDIIEYYPNGKLYNIRSYSNDGNIFLKQCNDSTGTILTNNGYGRWINFIDEDFKNYTGGDVINGLIEGEWQTDQRDTAGSVKEHKNDGIIYSKTFDKAGKEIITKVFTSEEVIPEYPGSIYALYRYLGKNIRYPPTARENGIQGRVILSFFIETDGALTDIKVKKGFNNDCDKEAVRVMKLSLRWFPAIKEGKAVRVEYALPISYTLGN